MQVSQTFSLLARVAYVPDSWSSIRLEASQVPGVIMIDSSQEWLSSSLLLFPSLSTSW